MNFAFSNKTHPNDELSLLFLITASVTVDLIDDDDDDDERGKESSSILTKLL